MTHRHSDWRARLNALLAANDSRPFAWGEWDCCIGLAAEAVRVIRADGKDFAAPWRGTYSTQTGAFRELQRRAGVRTPSELMTQMFGEPAPPAFARTGDLVSHQGCIGIMQGAEGVFIGCELMGAELSRDGLVPVPRTELQEAWHV